MKRVSSGYSPMIAVDRLAAKPLHRQVYDAYRAMIVGRNLGAGQRIPSTRALAAELRISRIPVLTAYAQLLAEGYFEARVGAGTFVCSALPDQVAISERRNAVSPSGRAQRQDSRSRAAQRAAKRVGRVPRYERVPWLRGLGAFSVSQPAYDEFPLRIWSSLVMRHSRNPHAHDLHYGGPMGSKRLRQAICIYLRTARGVHCEPGQVMIVSGSQQALDISTRVLLDEGSAAWVEEPTYWLTRHVLKAAGLRMVAVPVDGEGLDVAAGVRRCRMARAAFVAPSHQFPLGATMSASRRLQLLKWADRAGAWIIEDDYDSEYRYGSMPIAALQGLDHNARVVYVGTFSKTLFPALRMGYMVIPQDLVDAFVRIRHAMDLGTPHFYQGIVADFIEEGHYARHIRRMRVLYAERRKALVESIGKEFDGKLEVMGVEAGMFLAVKLPKGFQDTEIAQEAAREKLWLAPLSPAYLGAGAPPGFILGFGGTPAEEMGRAVRHLKELILRHARGERERRRRGGDMGDEGSGYCMRLRRV
jgi:GntR family transcriptional regulator / MocR family aminotransferase